MAGGLPLIIPHNEDPDAVLDLLDGLVLTGGGDLHPEHYGAATETELEDVSADDLVVTGRVGDVVEALESPDAWPMVGVQWHPEQMPEPEQQGLFRWLADAARGYRNGSDPRTLGA